MKSKHAILTISSINYLGQVTTLMNSAREHEPDAHRYVVLVDRKRPLPDLDPALVEVIWVEDLLGEELSRAAFVFTVLEFNTNVKPKAMLLACTMHSHVAYMDPDTELFAPMTPVWEALESGEIALTPHMLRPPFDDRKPQEVDLLRHGVFNLGFVAVREGPASRAFLQWWSHKCLTQGFNSPQDGLYVDQKFVDLAAVYYSDQVRVLRHPGLNVAYWNLHERAVRHDGGAWTVDGAPLVFMHFSGFIYKPSSAQARLISKYPSRVSLDTSPQLAPLFEGYRERLRANGFDAYAGVPYSFATFSDGSPIAALARRVVATNVPAGAAVGDYFDGSGMIRDYCRRARLQGGAGSVGASTDRPVLQRKLDRGQAVFRFLFNRLGLDRYMQVIRFCELMGSTLRQGFVAQPFQGKD